MGTGDRPIFPLINHRLDKGQLNKISTSLQETILRSQGQQSSGAGGLVSKLGYTLSYPTGTEVTVSFSPFRAAWSAPDGTDPQICDGGTMDYDPTRPLQATTSWPLEAFKDTNTVIWAKRQASNGVNDNQAYYSAGKKYAVTATMESEWIDIVPRAAASSAPDASFGWVRIAYIRAGGWSGYTPTIEPIYFPDSLDFNISEYPFNNKWSTLIPETSSFVSNGVGVSLGAQLRWIFNILSQIKDSTWSFDTTDGTVDTAGSESWISDVGIGLVQLDTITDDHESRLDELEATTGILNLFSAMVTWDNGSATYSMSHSVVTAGGMSIVLTTEVWNASKLARITFTGVPTTWAVTSVQVSKHSSYPITGLGTSDVPIIMSYATSEVLPYVGLGGVTTFVVDVGAQRNDPAGSSAAAWLECGSSFSINIFGLKN